MKGRRLVLWNMACLVGALVLIVLLNMLLFGDTVRETLVSPSVWMELVILAGLLWYLDK